ncbi:MAG TPA: lipocalin-like domain-containing protein [Ktedonosporobacter sp.]|nr:lipocalin-like domain-containing protein [Ktedonosporobacter sp.]
MSNRFNQSLCWVSLFSLLAFALSSCAFPGTVSSSQQLPAVSQTQQTRVLPPIRFPQDEGAHNNLTEWWYYTGHLQATDASGATRRYGFELVVFQSLRSDLSPIYASHFAITDVTHDEFHYDQRRLLEPIPIPDGTSTKGIDLHVGDWSIQGLNGQDHLAATMKDYAIDLHLSGLKPATLHNDNGIITLGVAGFSYYYSRTRMQVSGTLTDHAQALKVTGLAWMDHQWGNFLAIGGGGWDWYSIQLHNDRELLVYFVRDATGKILSTYLEYIDTTGKYYPILSSALNATVLATWTSPITRITYPSGWRLTIDAPQLHATLTITPQVKNQELVASQSTGNIYWEGAVSVQGHGNGSVIDGEGYVELTGYSN